jgi:hypothetical protein
MEGPVEETLGVPFQMLEQDPLADVGRKAIGVNDLTGETQYDPNSKRWSTLGTNLSNAAGGGAAMGGLFAMKPALQTDAEIGRAKRTTTKQKPPMQPQTNPRRSQAQLDEELRQMRSLERNPGAEEQ